MENTQTTPNTDFKVAPLFSVLLTIVLLALTVLFSALAVGKIDFSKLSSSVNNLDASQNGSQNPTSATTSTTADKTLSEADLANAKQVSDAYIADLQQGKTDAAFKLESPNYQTTRSQRPEMLHPSLYVPPSTPVVDAQSSGKTVDGLPDFVIVYRFKERDGSLFYIQILVDQLNGEWKVHGFTATPSHLEASY